MIYTCIEMWYMFCQYIWYTCIEMWYMFCQYIWYTCIEMWYMFCQHIWYTCIKMWYMFCQHIWYTCNEMWYIPSTYSDILEFPCGFLLMSRGNRHGNFNIQSTLVISKSKGPAETLRDIRTSTYQMCRIEENTKRTTKFHKWTCNLTPLIRNICWKYCGKGEKLLLRSNFSPYPQHFITWC